MLNFDDVEERDGAHTALGGSEDPAEIAWIGVTLSWNVWPSSRIKATRTVDPISALYTPLKVRKDLHPVPSQHILVNRVTFSAFLIMTMH